VSSRPTLATVVECPGCGHRLTLGAAIGEGAPFACGHCGAELRNVEALRAFRWRDVDPYVRRHGASRANLWGGLGGAALWLPLLAAVQWAQGRLDPGLLAALGIPYLLLLLAAARARARAPVPVWMGLVWAGLGAYLLLVAALLAAVPAWRAALPGLQLWVFGAIALATGGVLVVAYRRRIARLPRVSGLPPDP
jgi:DNA-directed RNA polymerase subunit RPC12/RpoP